ncbi:MAG TPA: hypothetical protein VFN96_03235 [Gemmatimonadales bacterium]|nr:hypothetical protein [Gemmatimonadales bacterium]
MRLRDRSLLSLLVLLALACDGTAPSFPTRSYRMGFSALPPRPDPNVILPNLEMWSQRADAAILHIPVPYAELLAGATPVALIQRDHRDLITYHRGKGQRIAITLDLTDGLDRAAESPELVALGRSLTEPEVQLAARQYAQAISSALAPEWLGLAAETNLIRAVAPAPLYDAVRQTANAAAGDLAVAGYTATLFVSVQVEVAWGWTVVGGGYQGVATDLQDFPFIEALGLSSYPYFVYADPDDLPIDYYSRIRNQAGLPVLVVEGGWTSASFGTVTSSAEVQRRYIARQGQLLTAAAAVLVVQLTFTDLDLSAFPQPVHPNLAAFAFLGLVDDDLVPKPALSSWDSLFALPRS